MLMMDATKIRAWWSHRQGLDGRLEGHSSSSVLEQAGWSRSVGGVGPYLTLFARAGIDRAAAEHAVAEVEIQELPCARGCTYMVPASELALALKVGQGFGYVADMKTARKLGVTDAEVEKLSAAVVTALKNGPLDPDALRQATGNAVRNLGTDGVKKGMTSTLPLAIGKLQSSGDIRRIPTNGRLDQQRYRYALWKPNPLGKFGLSAEEACTELARRFFRWIGPATLSEFQWFTGLGVKAARMAIDPLKLVPVEQGGDRLMFPMDRDELHSFTVPKEPRYALVSNLDSMILLRRDVRGLVVREDLDRRVFVEKDYAMVGGLSDLPSHAILDRGRLVGLWEYDTSSESIAWLGFVRKNRELEAAVRRTQDYVRRQLGDARSFSLDSPKSRAPRIEALRKLATGK